MEEMLRDLNARTQNLTKRPKVYVGTVPLRVPSPLPPSSTLSSFPLAQHADDIRPLCEGRGVPFP